MELVNRIFTKTNVLAAHGKIEVKLPPLIAKEYAYIKDFGIEMLGTHPLENLNGFIRSSSISYDTIYNACSALARAHLQKKKS